jgi:hypothetical protein
LAHGTHGGEHIDAPLEAQLGHAEGDAYEAARTANAGAAVDDDGTSAARARRRHLLRHVDKWRGVLRRLVVRPVGEPEVRQSQPLSSSTHLQLRHQEAALLLPAQPANLQFNK